MFSGGMAILIYLIYGTKTRLIDFAKEVFLSLCIR